MAYKLLIFVLCKSATFCKNHIPFEVLVVESGVSRYVEVWKPIISISVSQGFLNMLSSSDNSLSETPGEKPEGSMAAQFVGAAMEPSGFSPGVSWGSYRSLKACLKNFFLAKCRRAWYDLC
jgi:hypothetical protein